MNKNDKTRDLLMMHYHTYPQLKIQDVFKFLYQSAFGCEHMIDSPEKVKEKLCEEFNLNQHNTKNIIESLDGNYSRVYLGCMNTNLSPETFSKIFCLSAKSENDGLGLLEEKIVVANDLAAEGLLPFAQTEFEEAAMAWKAKGYPAVHHSDKFRDMYKPAYRVIANDYVRFFPLFEKLDKCLENGAVKLAVEGGSASGKTTLGGILEKIYDCTMIHMDDFFLRPEQRTPERYAEVGGNIDRERFLDEVLIPLSKNEQIVYRRFDCSTFEMLPPIKLKPKKLTVIEGVYSMHPEFQKYYDMSVFLDISTSLQKERILKRNQPQTANLYFNVWLPFEKAYFSKTNVKEKCTLRIPIQ